MDLLVVPYNDTGWVVEFADFAEKLIARWPDAILEERKGDLEFQLKTPHGDIHGCLEFLGPTQSPSLVIGYYLSWKECMALVLWYRTIVPSGQELLFCDEGYAEKIMLKADTTEEDLSRAFKHFPP